MPKRALLTPTSVNEIVPPKVGEIWVADTNLRGFGVRLWLNPTGKMGGAYCVRTKDKDGVMRRRTFSFLRDHAAYIDSFERATIFEDFSTMEFHELAGAARKWATDAIERIKVGFPNLAQENSDQKQYIKLAAAKATLEQVAFSTLKNMRAMGVSQAYFDRLNKLFFLNFPEHLRKTPICDFSGEDVWRHLESTSISPSNARVLRPFIRRIFSNYQELAGGRNKLEKSLRLRNFQILDNSNDPEDIAGWQEQEFVQRLDTLLSEGHYWQQAYCLRLFATTSGVPLHAFMAARWDEIGTISRKRLGRNDVQDLLVWERGSSQFNRVVFSGREEELLRALFQKSKKHSSGCNYLFPSDHRRNVPHIKSVDHVWRTWLHAQGIRHVSPVKFRKIYQGRRSAKAWVLDIFG